jgi:protein-L-isoaspartate(D-aspartate) O-methyltransferase
VPEELLQQLASGGRLIIPVGGENGQRLQLITRDKNNFNVEVLEQVKFVPLLCGQLQN